MATQQDVPTAEETPARLSTPAIDNEFAHYRAISPMAIVSMLLGGASVLAFVNLWFLLIAAAAILTGVLSIRKIRRLNDIFTGEGYARAGIALAVIFGIAAFTVTFTLDMVLKREVRKFADQYAEVLKNRTVEDLVYLQTSEGARQGKTPSAVFKDMQKGAPAAEAFEQQIVGLRRVKARIGAGGQEVHVEEIENAYSAGQEIGAAVKFGIHGKPTKDSPKEEELGLLVLKGTNEGGTYKWVVQEFVFPYQPGTYVEAAKPVDDGHGH